MKIVHIVPGTGGSFYCENCVRDSGLVKALRELGHEVIMVPMYLPLVIDEPDLTEETPIFFGAINIYLKQKFPLFKKAPQWIERLFDSSILLHWAARKAGSTRASGLEEMTLSMLRGEEGSQAAELEQLVTWLAGEGKPDVVYLANALLLGLARRIKKELGTPIVCALQDENTWLNKMENSYAQLIWQTLSERAKDVDAFVAVSHYYSNIIQERMQIQPERMRIAHVGIDLSGYETTTLPFNPPVIGYLSRMSESLGLGILVDAFIRIKDHERLRNSKLYITGGQTGDDRKFIGRLKKKLAEKNCLEDVKFFQNFDKNHRIQFLRSLTVLSVPITTGEAFGTFQIEALAAGVPVVQPKIGAFPEFINETCGGVLYEPNDTDSLARALRSLLLEPERVRELSECGRESVLKQFSNECMAKKMIEIYESVRKSA